MRYEGTVYRPPSEAGSLLIQATIGCPHNKCTFCKMYKDVKFRIRPVEEIKEDLLAARNYYGEYIESLFFPDGNTILMRTNQLVEIFEYAGELFPHLSRITVYGSSRFVNKKSLDDLKRLYQAGLRRVHTGMESGDDVTLARVCKGTTSQEIIAAGNKLKEAGIQVSEYYLTGIGGLERTREHAINSAKTLNQFSPNFIRIRTLVPYRGTALYEDYQNGSFQLLTAHQAMQEVRLLIENLECENSMLLSDHMANYANINGLIPRDKAIMLQELDKLLTYPADSFRQPNISRL
ncbi:putative oxygen-independent coproporphyrinogen iii oxidase [hydrocarbon metagenome]|uniref:Putative oxygen-independent coproporphyrinogen iii oxidase n=1 Tax=hydrocarbon metagenome TaxID=938273 RepID=A0A0W8E766_9ZZZZ